MPAFGATRVTDTTRLDTIGLPVFAAIRPHAGAGSVSVTSGKSLDSTAARVGALAEAFELASAGYVPGQSILHHLDFDAFRDRCGYSPWSLPVRISQLDRIRKGPPDGTLTFVPCDVLDDASPSLLPAVLAYFPYHCDLGLDLYGMSTNGVASGNSFEEAVLHGLLEVVERDIISFTTLGAPTRRVETIDNDDVQVVMDAVRGAGCDIEIVFAPNAFGIPTFSAFLFDGPPSNLPVFVGHGTHLLKDIAILRACTEAVQSRLTHIHGARDDILAYHSRWCGLNWRQKQELTDKIRQRNRREAPINYGEIADAGTPSTIGAALELTTSALHRQRLSHICVFRFPNRVTGMHAVRVVVPGLEFYASDRVRIGERLLSYARSRA